MTCYHHHNADSPLSCNHSRIIEDKHVCPHEVAILRFRISVEFAFIFVVFLLFDAVCEVVFVYFYLSLDVTSNVQYFFCY